MVQRYRTRIARASTLVRRWTAALVCLAVASLAPAQSVTGDFIPWLPPVFGGVATNPNAPGGFTILVDDDGDPFTPPVAYNLAVQAPALASQANYLLSPSRRFLYVLEDNSQGTTPSRLWFAQLDGAGGVSIVHGPYTLTGQLGSARVLQGPFFYESFGGLNTAVIIAGQPNGSEVWAQVFDLNTQGLSGEARVNLSAGLGAGTFAPSGTHLVIKNGLSDSDFQNVDFTLIDLCAATGNFGLASDIRVPSADIPPDPVFSVVAVGSGTVDIVGQIPGRPTPVFFQTLPDCIDAQPPVLGACCFDIGGTTGCSEGVTEFQCGTNAFFAGATCDQACPQPEIEIFGGAPATVAAGQPLTYSFTVLNTGSVVANNVIVSARAPAGQTITGFSQGGTLGLGQTLVSWALAPLAPGADRTVTMSVTTPCNTGTITLPSTSYEARIGSSFFRGTTLSTQVVSSAGGQITLTVDSVASGTEPAIQGDFITHTLTMANSGSIDAIGLRLECIRLGPGNSLDAILDDAGGSITLDDCAPGRLTWEGDLPAMSTRTLIFRTRIDCVSPANLGGPFGVWLNQGAEIWLRGGGACNNIVARETARRIETTPPMRSSLTYSEVNPGTLRFHPNVLVGFNPTLIAFGRLGEEAEILLTVENPSGPDLQDAFFEYSFANTFRASGSPFVGAPPPGVTWDPVAEAVRYTGPLATGEVIEVRLRAEMTSILGPGDEVTVAPSPGCDLPVFPDRNARLYAVPEPSGGPEAHGVSTFAHSRFDEPFGTLPTTVLPAFGFEGIAGIGAGPDGTLYVYELLYSYLINPGTLNFAVFDEPAAPQDADPVSGGVVHTDRTSIWRYLPDGSRVEVYRNTDGSARPDHAAVTDDGIIHVMVDDGSFPQTFRIVSLDPDAGPLPLGPADLTGEVVTPTITPSYAGAFGPVLGRGWSALADDGTDLFALFATTYAGTDAAPGATRIISLVRIDPVTRAVTVIDPDLSIDQGTNAPPLPPDADPTFQAVISDLPFIDPARGPVYELSFGSAYSFIDTATGIPTPYIRRAPDSPNLNGLAYLGVRCGPADINNDGALTFADVTLFTQLFDAGSPSADLAPPFGEITFADMSAFLSAFSTGCP